MATMRALVYDKPGRQYSGIRDIERPVPGDDEVIIRVMSASICKGVEHDHDQEGVGTDLAQYPVVPGHEFAGIVDEVGANVTGVKPGDRVTADNTEYCGSCYYCKKEESNYCPVFGSLGHNINGGFAGYVRLKKEKVFHIPDNVSFNAASLCEPIACCIHCVDRCGIKYGDTVAVLGAGPMGLILAQLIAHSSAFNTVVIAPTKSKLDVAEKLGVSAIQMDKNDYGVHEKAIFGKFPEGVDCVVDTTGSVELMEHSLKLLKKGGRLVQYSFVHSRKPLALDTTLMFNNELTYTASFCQSHNFGRAVDAIASGKINADVLVTHEFDLEHFYDALDENVNNHDSIKVTVHPNKA